MSFGFEGLMKESSPMIGSLQRIFLTAIIFGCVLTSDAATAHPHVWVTMRSELVYAPDGAVTGIRQAWTFDDLFSTYATQGMKQKKKGTFSREELAPLAEVNVTTLKDSGYFTRARADGKRTTFNEPIDYWLDYNQGALTLHFTLPFKAPVRARDLVVEIYDPTWFVDFGFNEKNPFALVGAPSQCKFTVQKPRGSTVTLGQVGEDFFNSLTSSGNWGAQFANKVSVQCP
jgi:ABC-type uncharacterized transport system substrate-binding protein